jgi:hypothetical protein
MVDAMYHPFFQETSEYNSLPLLNQLVTLYVDNAHLLWKDDRVIEWLKPNLEIVLRRVDASENFFSLFFFRVLKDFFKFIPEAWRVVYLFFFLM